MRVDEFVLGEEDARNLNLKTKEERAWFVRSFVTPRGFKLNDYLEGRKFFVSGSKGTGKTALLQYIRISAEEHLGAVTGFYYFQSSFRKSELRRFKSVLQKNMRVGDDLVDDPEFLDGDEIPIFWRLFFLSEISKLLKRARVTQGPAEAFLKTLEALKLISRAANVGKKYPSLEKFHARLSRDPLIDIEGSFQDAQPEDIDIYMGLAEDQLEDVYLENRPIFLFLDELEIYRSNDGDDALHFAAVASLVRAVRDFNERFHQSDIRIIAAIRSEVVSEVSLVQGEVYRIVLGRGVQIGWNETARSGYHPLEKMVLKNIASQDPEISEDSDEINERLMDLAFAKYFYNDYSLSNALDLTWYRPRDMALLFECAQLIDEGRNKFMSATLRRGVLPQLGERMLTDAKAGLGVKYRPIEINAMDRLLRGGRERYTRVDFQERLEELSHLYDDVAMLSDNKWTAILEDLYRVGVIYTVSKKTGYKNFFFRGDPMPSFTDDFEIGVHQTLINELSIQSK